MNELNEKLAELVMGWESVGKGTGCHFYFPEDRRHILAQDWTPTQDLNQLKMCYEALSEDWGEDNSVTFEYAFTEELTILIRGTKVKFGAAVTGIELATAWGKHPELVAQAILKAKEVS